MTVGKSLLSQIPIPQNSGDIKVTTPLASVKVGEVEQEPQTQLETQPKSWLEKLKNKLVEYRMNKIANKSPEQRTPNEQAEFEANQKSMNYMI